MREMKNSGIEWIGDIPVDWAVRRNKYNFTLSKEIVGNACEQTQLLSLTKFGIKAITEDDQKGKVPTSFATYQCVNKDDIVMCLFDLDVSAVFSGISPYEGMISPAYKCFKCNEHVVPQYIDYYFRTVFVDRKYKRYSKNVRFSIGSDEFMALPIILPPVETQQAISNFLDSKCAEIDALMADIQAQIETLEQYKRSVITEAVTKGLDPNVEMKDSGISGAGEIPSYWKTTRLSYESYIRARLGWRGLKADEYVEEGYAFISAFNIQNGRLVWMPLNYITKERYDESPEIKIHVGDVLIVKDGAGVGKCARVDELPMGGTAPNSSIAVITPNESQDYRYMCYYLQSAVFSNFVLLLYNGMGVPHLTQEVMSKIKMPMPPSMEQMAIADFLDTKCSEIDACIATKKEQLSTLDAYKKSLIYEYVTGKKEVV